MDKKSVLKILSRFREALESRGVRITRLILFGSHVEGNSREGSDIDVIVVSEDFSGKSYWQRIDILSDALYEVFEPIEATAMTPEEWERRGSTLAEYAKDGEIIYGT